MLRQHGTHNTEVVVLQSRPEARRPSSSSVALSESGKALSFQPRGSSEKVSDKTAVSPQMGGIRLNKYPPKHTRHTHTHQQA